MIRSENELKRIDRRMQSLKKMLVYKFDAHCNSGLLYTKISTTLQNGESVVTVWDVACCK